MKRLASFLVMVLVSISGIFAQSYDTVSIEKIQKVPQGDLANCEEESKMAGDTVVIKATVVMDGDLSRIQGAESRNIWVQQGKGPWSGIDIFGFSDPTSPVDIQNLVAGDSVMITGEITEFDGETEIIPLTGNNVQSVHLIGQGQPVQNKDLTVDVLNDQNRKNKLTTGEKWEGSFVTIKNATVVSVQNFTGDRYSFDIKGPNGGRMNVSDQFLAQRTPQNDTAGNFQPPSVGTSIDSIKGVITHALNDCPGASSRGYELNPFDSSHYNYGAAPPTISDISVNPLVPDNNEQATVSATITDVNGVQEASLFYAAGINANNYTKVSMTNTSGDTYEGTIPGQNNITWVKFYVQAKDNQGLENTIPDVPNNSQPEVYKIKDNPLSIYDIQFTPFIDAPFFSDASVYQGKEITVEGVVTATNDGKKNNLNAIFIQEPNQSEYAGVQLTNKINQLDSTLDAGEQIEVTGEVEENFGMTVLTNFKVNKRMGETQVNAPDVHPANFSSGQAGMDNEPYEGMLVNLTSDTSKLYVVDTNPDAPDNFGEYRVGVDTFDPNTGTRILAGRNTSNVFSSNNVSYINSEQWANSAGQLNVKSKPVAKGNSMDSLKGILVYSFSNYKALPRSNKDFYNYSDSVREDDDNQDTSSKVILEKETDLNVFPNPTEGKVTIQVNKNQLDGSMTISVIDMTGNVVHHEAMPANTKTSHLNLQEADAGVYVIRLRDQESGKTYQRRIMVE